MKFQHIYTVTRTFDVPDDKLQGEIDFMRAIHDESGEYLYGGCDNQETIDVYMRVFKNGEWKTVKTK